MPSRTRAGTRRDVADGRRTIDRDRSRVPGPDPHRGGRASPQSRARGRVGGACGSPASSRRTGKGAGRRSCALELDRPAEGLGGPAPLAGGLRQHPLKRPQVHTQVAGASPSTVTAIASTKLVRGTHSRSASSIPARAFPRSSDRASSTSSFDSNTTRPRVAQEREAQALASTCVDRLSSCTAVKSRAARASTVAAPALRSLSRRTSVPPSPSAMLPSDTAVLLSPSSKSRLAVTIAIPRR